MMSRIISGVVLAAAVLGLLLWAPAAATLAVIALAILAGAWEWSAFLHPRGAGERLAFIVLVAVVGVAGWSATADDATLRAMLWLALGWWLYAVSWVLRGPQVITRLMAWVAGVMVLVPAGIALARLRVSFEDGAQWTLYLLLLVWAADTGAYFAGRAFGRRRLAPRVSPGKTWEGLAGGLALAGVWAAIGAHWLGQPTGPMLLVGLAVAAVSVVGDLTESLLKRYAGVKDSGHLIPGHGGVMDRLDSITAAAPALLLCVLEVLEVAR